VSLRKTPHIFYIALSLAFLILVTGCSLKSPSSLQKVRISIPSSSNRSLVRNPQAVAMTMASPTALSDFTCYGVKVTGPGIADDSRMGCSPADGVGIIGGLVPATGGTVDLLVPSGTDRRVVVFGVQSSEGCASMNDILNRPPASRFVNFGNFYSLGESTVAISDDTTVNVTVAFTGSNSQIFSGCPGYTAAIPSQPGMITVSSGAVIHASGGTSSNQVQATMILGSPIQFSVGSVGGQAVGGTGASQVTWKQVDTEGNPR
jgi:hypothetical protein